MNSNVKIHVFEPEDAPTQMPDWYKDITTFSYSKCFDKPELINVGDIVEDNMGTRFRITSRHWKWSKNNYNKIYPVIEFTAERYMRHGKQNPFML